MATAVAMTVAIGLRRWSRPVAVMSAPRRPGSAPTPALWRRLRKGDDSLAAEIAAFCETVARSLQSAASFHESVWVGMAATSGPLRRALEIAQRKFDAGATFDSVLFEAARECGDPAFHRVVDAIALCRPTGGPTVAVFEVLADAQRQEIDLTRELEALAAPARTSAMMIGLLPLGFVVLSALIDPGVISALTRWPLGIACLVGGVLLEVAGFTWMRRLVVAVRW